MFYNANTFVATPKRAMMLPAIMSPYASKKSSLIQDRPINPSHVKNNIVPIVAMANVPFTKIIAMVPYLTVANVMGKSAIQGVRPKMATRHKPAFLSFKSAPYS